MQFRHNVMFSRFIGHREGRRVPGRLPQDELWCNLGPVLDLSTGGMRLLCTKRHTGPLRAELKGADMSMRLEGRVAWTRRLGFRRHELGLAFLNVDDTGREILSRIAQSHRARRAI